GGRVAAQRREVRGGDHDQQDGAGDSGGREAEPLGVGGVGWVERSETHQGPFYAARSMLGFADAQPSLNRRAITPRRRGPAWSAPAPAAQTSPWRTGECHRRAFLSPWHLD